MTQAAFNITQAALGTTQATFNITRAALGTTRAVLPPAHAVPGMAGEGMGRLGR